MSLRTVRLRNVDRVGPLSSYTIPRPFFLFILFLRSRCVADLSLDYPTSQTLPYLLVVGFSSRILYCHYRSSVGDMC